MAQRTGTLQINPPASPIEPPATSLAVTVTGSTVAGAATQTLDLVANPAATFQANDGDFLTISGNYVNAVGPGPSASITLVVALGVVTPSSGGLPPDPSFASATFV